MFRTLNENIYVLCWIFAALLVLCVSGCFITKVIIKRRGVSLKFLLRGEQYVFASLSSVLIFLIFSFPAALAAWILFFLLMNFACDEMFKTHTKSGRRMLPFSIFASGTIGIAAAFFTYDGLFESYDSLLTRLTENCALLSCVLFPLYLLLYFSTAGNFFHYMHGHKRLFKILFAAFSVIMYVCVTLIAMNVRVTTK